MSMTMVQSSTAQTRNDLQSQQFTALAREFYKPVYRFITRQISNQADAADLTQQVFVRGYQSFSRFDQERDFAPWIFTIARRCLVDHFRRYRPESEPVQETIRDTGPTPREAALDKDGAEQLWSLTASLKPKFNQVLSLHYRENFSLRETAQVMGITETHAKVLVFRARAALKKYLQSARPSGGSIQ
jgi:RNA polymerase sigma-70 factor (ECF subfamily)